MAYANAYEAQVLDVRPVVQPSPGIPQGTSLTLFNKAQSKEYLIHSYTAT